MKQILVVIAGLTVLFGAMPARAGPTGDLLTLYGTPEKLQFTYSPGNTVSLGSTAQASAVGSNADALAFLEISNNSNPFALNGQLYFEGAAQTGQTLLADATVNPLTGTPVAAPDNQFSTAPGAELYAYVFSNQADFDADAAPIQTMTYSTASADGMFLGDTIGSLQLVGYVGVSGSFVAPVPEPSSVALFGVGLFAIGSVSRRRHDGQQKRPERAPGRRD